MVVGQYVDRIIYLTDDHPRTKAISPEFLLFRGISILLVILRIIWKIEEEIERRKEPLYRLFYHIDDVDLNNDRQGFLCDVANHVLILFSEKHIWLYSSLCLSHESRRRKDHRKAKDCFHCLPCYTGRIDISFHVYLRYPVLEDKPKGFHYPFRIITVL